MQRIAYYQNNILSSLRVSGFQVSQVFFDEGCNFSSAGWGWFSRFGEFSLFRIFVLSAGVRILLFWDSHIRGLSEKNFPAPLNGMPTRMDQI